MKVKVIVEFDSIDEMTEYFGYVEKPKIVREQSSAKMVVDVLKDRKLNAIAADIRNGKRAINALRRSFNKKYKPFEEMTYSDFKDSLSVDAVIQLVAGFGHCSNYAAKKVFDEYDKLTGDS